MCEPCQAQCCPWFRGCGAHLSTLRPLRVVVAAKLEVDALDVKSALNPSQMASGWLPVVHSSLLRWITALMTGSRSWLQLQAKSGGSCSGLGLTNVLTSRLLVVILHFGGNTRFIQRSALSCFLHSVHTLLCSRCKPSLCHLNKGEGLDKGH